ncbi:glucose-6-phosphate dehydrogenase [Alkalibacter rhizosphaerae]|uniref:Glucose-6-phosphate 1-dehydrogenase n=1 Tax=Alkalibacter rhizosphaerae TaxID=2815577 RepID=A0A974XHT6_9FIRM|nr:glucose-6-phosphate dehydrogenase [Alkalibacter rhizosphaerae]QSX08628.1 glucose-6-phosphate dehydrogenase [Alkalibacter rhizosphaerae]
MNELSCTMIIFGATGDLTRRKLIPALHQLQYGGHLPEDFQVVAIGRREITQEEYREDLFHAMVAYTRILIDEDSWETLARRITYYKMDLTKTEEYRGLQTFLKERQHGENFSCNQLFYLAMAPEFFTVIVDGLKDTGILEETGNWNRLVLEKPFGKDLASAKVLNENIQRAFREEQIFRIDHYLGKEMIQNITMLRFQNTIFEPLWNSRYIDNIQISVSELDGVGSRAPYYDQTGALRDMVQNHLLQTLAITAMDPPKTMEADQIRDAKVKLLSELILFTEETSKTNVVFGQYESYKNEIGVQENSVTETFVALKLFIDNARWRGVPFYLTTGKKLPEKSAQVTVEFKAPNQCVQPEGEPCQVFDMQPGSQVNILEIKIQPKEGISLRLNTKKPSVISETVVAEMEYCQSCQNNFNTPDAYEKLLLDVIHGDSTRFTRWDELALTWYFIDSIHLDQVPLCEYEDLGRGPWEAHELLERDQRKWWHVETHKKEAPNEDP